MSFLSDIAADIRNLSPTARDLRKLGLSFLIVLGLIGAFLTWRGRPAGLWLLGLGIFFGLWGLAWPHSLGPVYRAWMSLAVILGAFVSRILLTIIFYLVVTPIGVAARLLGKDFLDLKLRDRETYWRLRRQGEYDPRRSEKMY